MSKNIWIPRKDQEKVLEFILPKKRAAIWAPTGAGKTAIAATWICEGMDDLRVAKVLIVAPKLVARDGWTSVWQEWRHLEHLAHDVRLITFEDLGLTRQAGQGMEFRDKRATKRRLLELGGRVHVCSWDAFPWVAKALGGTSGRWPDDDTAPQGMRGQPRSVWQYDTLVLDESSFLRDQGSDRSRAARHAVHRTGVVEQVLELTASPAANHQEAVYAQLDLIEPGILGRTLTDFRETYCVPESKNWQTGQVYRWKVAPAMQAAFEQACAKVAISVPSSLEVPLVVAPVWVTPSDAASEAAGAFLRDSVWRGITCGSAAVQHAKLRQCASGFVYDESGGPVELDTIKLDRLEELIESIDGPVLLAYQWTYEFERIKARFGKQVADIRETGAKSAFESGKLPILALHPASAGHGVDGLQKISQHVVWTTVPEDRELYDQTNGRLHRHGTQADTVYVHVLVARGTREHQVWDEVLPGKATVQDLILRATSVLACS